MDNKTLFYILGIALAVSAVVISFVGLRFEKFPGSRAVLAGVLVYFAAMVGATATFAVMNANDEQSKEAEEEASNAAESKTISTEESTAEQTTSTAAETTTGNAGAGGGGGSTIKVTADPTGQLKFEETAITAGAGKDTIDFTNDSPVGHNVQIEDSSGAELGGTKTITGSSTTATVDLKPGKYTFLCTVPGHAEAGMKGTLTVK